MKNHIIKLLFSACLLFCVISYTQIAIAQGSQIRSTVKIAPNNTTNAWLHLPDDYDQTSATYPLLIFLHGVGEGSSLDAGLSHGVPRMIAKGANMEFTVGGKLFKFIVVSPQIPGGWASEVMVQNIMDDIKSRYRVDPSRVYLTGLSAGAYGVLNYVATDTKYSDNLAAIVPVSPAAIDAAKVPGLCNVASSNIAVWMLCGGADGFIDNQDAYTKQINSCNPTTQAITTTYPGGGHGDDVWDKAYDVTHIYQQPNIYEWMLQYQRGTTPGNPPGTPPVANITPANTTITLPSASVSLNGSTSTAPNSAIKSYAWTQVSGPGTATITNGNSAIANVSRLVAGKYVFKLTLTNTAGTTAATTTTVVVNAASGGGNPPACNGCKFLITPGADGGAYINGDTRGVQPGDTVCIQSGNYSYIQFFNFTGAADKPIVFINCGGQVKVGNGGNYGLIFNNVKYFKVTGSGSSDKYGFRIDGVVKKLSSGLAMGKGCTDYEAERVEITGSEVGCMAKINPDCDPMNQYPNFAIRNVKLHDLYIHETVGEGMYVGNTAPNGTLTPCNGVDVNLLPPRIYNLKIYNVTTENTGWDGIQVASAPENVEIYNNSVYNYGTTNMGSQQAGIILGGESNGKVYNNKIVKGTGNGIEVFGTGLSWVYNNVLVDAGIDGTTTGQDALFVDDRPTKNNYKPLVVYLFNNTVVNSGRDGIRVQNSFGTIGQGNLLYNNLVVSSGSVSSRGQIGYINLQAGIDYLSANNVTGADINAMKFVNAASKDFHLAAGSPAIDKGRDLSAYFKTDLDGNARPYGAGFDAGAYEYIGSTPANKPPVADAGNDITITLPVSTASLDGTGSTDPDGTIAAYRWAQVSGPVTATFSSNTNSKPTVSKLTTAGTYVFELTVTDDKGATATARVTVTVKDAPVYIPPTVSAGTPVTITLPVSTTTLTGTASAAAGSTLVSYQWSQVSGPVNAAIGSATTLSTDVTKLTTAGQYVFQLTVTDDKGQSASSTVTVTVKDAPVNIPPTVSAGTPVTITLPVSATTLTGTASAAAGSTLVSYQWSQVSGPVDAAIGSATALSTDVTKLTTAGQYVFQLTVTDDKGQSASSTVTVTVKDAPVNIPPTVSAGTPVTITLPVSTTTLTGTASAAAGSTLVSYQWSQVSGPVNAAIGSATTLSTDVTKLTTAGQYVFQLTVTDDKGQSASSTVTVTVKDAPVNIPPTVSAGTPVTITLPVSATTLTGTASAAAGSTLVSYQWSQVSGPVDAAIGSATALSTGITKLTTAGQYVFQLTVTDDKGQSASSTVTVTVKDAPVNIPPTVSAGTPVTITLPVSTTTLTGTASAAAGSTLVSYQWSQVSGPVDAAIGSATALSTGITKLTTAGQYVFQLTVTDDKGQSASSTVTVTVKDAPVYIPPTVSAGNPVTITLPVNATTLTGTASPAAGSSIVSYKWSQVSGPLTAKIATPAAITTTVSQLTTPGSYVFRLSVTDDKGQSAFADVTVTVMPVKGELVANAGNSQVIQLPVSSVILDGSKSYSTGGRIVKYLWQLQTSSLGVAIASPGESTTTVNFSYEGIYVFLLTITDENNNTATATVSVAVKGADHNGGVNEMSIFPNPVSTQLTLKLDLEAPAPILVRIFNNTGQIVTTFDLGTVTHIRQMLDVTNLLGGVYILQVSDNKAFKMSKKFVKVN